MANKGNIQFYTLGEIKDKHIGKAGTPERDKYGDELQLFFVGEAIQGSPEIEENDPN